MYIPKKILLVAKQVSKGSSPTYPVDPENKKRVQSARDWAGTGYSEITIDNDSITDIRIDYLDIRGQGGRAYRVVIGGKYEVDMRENVLLDVMEYTGIEPGKKLNGEFVFVAEKEMRLVLKDKRTNLYKQALKKTVLHYKSKIGLKQLEIGGAYENKTGSDELIYLGKGSLLKFDYYCNKYKDLKQSDLLVELKDKIIKNKHLFWDAKVTFQKENVLEVYNNLSKLDIKQKGIPRTYGSQRFQYKSSSYFINKKFHFDEDISFKTLREKIYRSFMNNLILKSNEISANKYRNDLTNLWFMYFTNLPFGINEKITIPDNVIKEMMRRFSLEKYRAILEKYMESNN